MNFEEQIRLCVQDDKLSNKYLKETSLNSDKMYSTLLQTLQKNEGGRPVDADVDNDDEENDDGDDDVFS